MKTRKFMFASLLIIAILLITGCSTSTPAPEVESSAPESEAPAAAAKYHFCVVHNNADHPSITAVVHGMDDEAAAYGIKMTYFDPAFDPQKQLSMIEDCIALKPDAILVNAVDPAAVVPGLKKVTEAGIPLIMHNADTNEEGHQYSQTFVGSDFVEQGRAVGEAMVKYLPDGAKCVVIQGKPGQTGVAERTNGALEVIEKSGKSIEFIDYQPAEWMKDKALTVMQDFLTRYPSGELQCVYALDDPMALGALEAIKAADRLDELQVYGVGGFVEACQAIKAGEMKGSALHPSYLVGVDSIRAAYDAAKGRPLPDVINAPTAPITPDNIEQMTPFCW